MAPIKAIPPPPGLGTVEPLRPQTSRSVPMQPFEKPPSSAEELDLRERLTEETDKVRDKLGAEKRAAREAVRKRLSALRAAKEASEASDFSTF
ncbi:hypothetical protein AK812_SmicGene3772 [Symbiodinium microadriaticum]|uniref:Uncharacterized protein n=1 Tax=Symbiodinium microadriaticum TaxID=2951 RepID=A0A1Q9EXX1_SYMMI|nr:hypothetical protein AK812_SmicGene3772 [Symbiodinium microadriaticum]